MTSLTRFNVRPMRAQGFQTEAFLSFEHGRVRVMEDFDITLQILRAGGSCAVNYYYAQGQRMTNEAGGCSTWRTHEIHEESARRLAELHPGIVSLRQKQNKGDQNGFGTRTEVTIQWKSAWAEGQLRANERSASGVQEQLPVEGENGTSPSGDTIVGSESVRREDSDQATSV